MKAKPQEDNAQKTCVFCGKPIPAYVSPAICDYCEQLTEWEDDRWFDEE